MTQESRMTNEQFVRHVEAVHALAGYIRHDGATKARVLKQMRDDGFTPDEIARAASDLLP